MTTNLHIKNDSIYDVTAYITLGATPGCIQNVADLIISNGITMFELNNLQGYFILPEAAELKIAAPTGVGLNGNISFDTPPLNCPTPNLPDGVNLAEFIINNGFQPGGQETVDISCVCGANAFIEFELSADDWTTNGGAIPVKHIKNDVRYKNTGLVGVFPYGCDNCTASTNPPGCIGLQPQNANTLPICNVQRSASSNNGGTVLIKFKGFTPVPF